MELTKDAVEAIALDALTFIASDDDVLSRFVAMTGIDPATIRTEIQKEGFLRGVMHPPGRGRWLARRFRGVGRPEA